MSDYGYTERVTYCKCGSTIKVRSHHGVTDKCIDFFWTVHSGEGHGKATRQQARRTMEASCETGRRQ